MRNLGPNSIPGSSPAEMSRRLAERLFDDEAAPVLARGKSSSPKCVTGSALPVVRSSSKSKPEGVLLIACARARSCARRLAAASPTLLPRLLGASLLSPDALPDSACTPSFTSNDSPAFAPPTTVSSAPCSGNTAPQCRQRTETAGFSFPQDGQIMVVGWPVTAIRRIIPFPQPAQQALSPRSSNRRPLLPCRPQSRATSIARASALC